MRKPVTVLLAAAFSLGVLSAPHGAIKHVIVLMEENRSFDHIFGFSAKDLGVDGLTGKEFNRINSSDPNSRQVFVDNQANYINPCDPNHGTYATSCKIFGKQAADAGNFTDPAMIGFVEWEASNTDYCGVVSMFAPGKLPVITALAKEFAVMDRFFCSHAGPTWPNRMFCLSGTSAGSTSTGPWYRDQVGSLFPQKTIFDQLQSEGLTWRNYYNDTPWELFMQTLAHSPDNQKSMEQFYADAREGNLPNFAWINPRSGINVTTGIGSNDQHPDHDMAAGEQFYKDIYEALRASPQWNETLFVITYDEHGGFYDHVPTPLNVPPPGDGETSYPEKGILFDRLGVRIPTLLISPWIPRGVVVSAPPESQKPAFNSEFDLTSIPATTRKLLGMKSGALTKRDAWAATFEHVLSLSEPRTDCPMHLPDAPPPTQPPHVEAALPVNPLQSDISAIHAHLSGANAPQFANQAEVSKWLLHHYQQHAERTKNWRASKDAQAPTYAVRCRPSAASGWADQSWDIKVPKTAAWNTVSTLVLRDGNGVPYCLDAGNATVGTTVAVSLCYPSNDPDTNRDVAQHWIWGKDSTLRPFADQTLCATNRQYYGDLAVYLTRCVDAVEQHWGYHGPAPGDDGGGALYFGDDTNSLGVVKL